MIVITRNGRTTVITGRRAWLMGLVALIAAWAVMALIAFVLIGVAITLGVMLLLLVPAAVIVALLGTVMRRGP